MNVGDEIIIELETGEVLDTVIEEILGTGIVTPVERPCSTHTCFIIGWREVESLKVKTTTHEGMVGCKYCKRVACPDRQYDHNVLCGKFRPVD